MKSLLCAFLLIVIAFFITVKAYADEAYTITLLEIIVSVDKVTVSVNVPAEFSYQRMENDNTFEVFFQNCKVNILGENHTDISSFMPFFDTIMLESDDSRNVARLMLKHKEGIENITMEPSKYLDKIEFRFKIDNSVDSNDKTDEGFPSFILKRDVQIDDSSYMKSLSFKVRAANLNPFNDIKPIAEPVDLIPLEIPKYHSPMSDYPKPGKRQPVAVQETQIPPEVGGVPIFPDTRKTRLESVHYAQGRLDRDVITFEFEDVSPSFDFGKDETGKVILIFHNLEAPEGLFPENEIKSEVKGTFLRSIYLKRFYEQNKQALEVIFTVKEPVNADIDDLGGIMDIIFQKDD